MPVVGCQPSSPRARAMLYRVERPMIEEVCAENNLHLFDYGVPVAEKPDF